jgi:hypothetical protein
MKIPYAALLDFALLSLAAAALAVWIGVVLIARRRGVPAKCPRCLSRRFRPSWPRPLDKALPKFVRAHRCESCKRRFFAARPAVREK